MAAATDTDVVACLDRAKEGILDLGRGLREDEELGRGNAGFGEAEVLQGESEEGGEGGARRARSEIGDSGV